MVPSGLPVLHEEDALVVIGRRGAGAGGGGGRGVAGVEHLGSRVRVAPDEIDRLGGAAAGDDDLERRGRRNLILWIWIWD